MKIPLEELLSRMERGEDLEQLHKSLITPPERELLKRCAVVRSFDRALVDAYFRPGVPGGDEESVPFTRLVSHDFVEHVPRAEGVFRLQPPARQEYFRAWWLDHGVPSKQRGPRVPASLREFGRALSVHYESLGEAGELDLLAQLAVCDPERARGLFNRLYDESDAAFDLARCRDLINVLSAREHALGGEFAAYLRDKNRYLLARSLWSVEYYQTARYLERESLTRAAEAFLAASPGAGRWILNINAPGGRGKTMFLRWLVSRRCVPEPHRLLCAKIDFDLVDRERTIQHPWLLVLHIARQLEAQTPGGQFRHIVRRLSEFESILDNAQAHGIASAPLLPGTQIVGEISGRFATAIGEACSGRPVVLILDTLEEIMLYYRERIMAVMEQMQTLHYASPNILLILSGRYDLTDNSHNFTEFVERYGAHTQSLEVEPFTEAESIRFLTEKMRLTEDRPLRAVAEKSEGNPFKLSLFADLLRDDPSISEETVRSYPDVDLLYLIERVLSRLRNQQLHWLLRYGVVPRRLTFSFLNEVMKKYLLRAMSGDTSQDDPRRYGDLPREARSKKILGTDLIEEPSEGAVDLDALWQQLRAYASTNAWVSPAAPADTETVVFHGDVVNPMRRWLRGEPVYGLLHADAVGHFEGKARADTNNWAKWMREAVYHKFQLEGEEAYAYWRLLLDGPEAADNHRWRREIAREVAGSEYVDDQLEPRKHTGARLLISRRNLVEALYESARTALHIARETGADAKDALWSEAEVDLRKCEQVQGALPKAVISPLRLRATLAVISAGRGADTGAAEALAKALDSELPDGERIDLLHAYAVTLARQGMYQEAIMRAESAIALALRLKHPNARLLYGLYKSHAGYLQAVGLWEHALRALRMALEYVKPGDTKSFNRTLMQTAEVCVESGLYARAAEEAERLDLGDDEADVTRLWLQTFTARLRLALLDPVGARAAAQSAFHDTPSGPAKGVPEQNALELIALAREVHGVALGELMEYDAARRSLERARVDYQKIGDRSKANRCLLRMVQLLLTCVGDVKEADALLEDADRLTLQTGPDEWVYQRLLKTRVLHLSGKVEKRQKLLEQLQAQASKEDWPVRTRVTLLLEGGRFDFPEGGLPADELFVSLTELLGRVWPAPARLDLLDSLREYPTGLSVSRGVVAKLIELVSHEPLDEDYGLQRRLRLAELYRVTGDSDRAREILSSLTGAYRKRGSIFAMREALVAWGKLGWRPEEAADVSRCIKVFMAEFAPYHALRRAFLIDTLKLAVESKLPELAAEQLALADEAGEKMEGSQWDALLREVRGQVNARDDTKVLGRAAEAIEYLEKAANIYLEKAADIYQNLNNSAAADLLRAVIGRTKDARKSDESAAETGPEKDSTPNVPPAADPEPVVSVRLESASPEEPAVKVSIPERPTTTRRISTNEDAETDALADSLLAYETTQSYSYRFLKQLDADWVGTCDRLGDLLLGRADAKALWKHFGRPEKRFPLGRRGGNRFDFRLAVDHLQLSSVPWELMEFPQSPDGAAAISPAVRYFYRSTADGASRARTDTAWLQKALSTITARETVADGMLGPRTAEHLRRFQSERGLGVTGVFDAATRRRIKQDFHGGTSREAQHRVLLMQPRAEHEGDSFEISGGDLKRFYREANFPEGQVVTPPTAGQLERVLEKFTPEVVHVCASVQESLSVGLYLDFNAAGRYYSSGTDLPPAEGVDGLPVTALNRLLRRIKDRAGTRPHFILDVLCPEGRTELLTQLLLRNAFATQLFRFGNCASVIATGLSPIELELRHPTIRALARALGRDEGAGEAVNAMRSVAVRDPEARGWKRFSRPPEQLLEAFIATVGTVLLTDEPRA